MKKNQFYLLYPIILYPVCLKRMLSLSIKGLFNKFRIDRYLELFIN